MEETRKIKEYYDCQYDEEEVYPLQKWYNQLIDKTMNELTIADVLRMMRQELFVDLAMERAMVFLEDDVFAGEAYDGQLLEGISRISTSYLAPYSDRLNALLKIALDRSELHEWSYEGEREEFEQIVDSVSKRSTEP